MSNLLENSTSVIKAKSIITILLLFKMDPHWMIIVDEFKFYSICDRMSRDYSKYIQYCCLCLIDGVHDLINKIVVKIKINFSTYLEDCTAFDKEKDTILNNTMKETKKRIKVFSSVNLHGYMVLIVALFNLLKSQLFKNKVISKEVIILIGYILENTGSVDDDNTKKEIKTFSLQILEQICNNQKVTLTFNKTIVDHILPTLITKIQDSDQETKFNCLKALTDLIIKYLSDDKIYDADGTQETTKKINEMILKRLFPHYGSILSDSDPLPQYGLKLLCAIVERNSAFVTILKKLKLVDIMMEYFVEDHPRFNGHLIKIICGIVESKELKLEDLQEYNLVKKLNKVLAGVIESDSHNFLDPLLDIVYELLHYIAETMRESVRVKC